MPSDDPDTFAPVQPAPLAGPAATLDAAPAFSPLYLQIKASLVRSLQAAEWQPGEAIPSETELAARFKVSQGTVRKAIDELATENLLVRRQGKGTFVATHGAPETRYRFLRLTPDQGASAALSRRLLGCRRVRASAEVARALGLSPGDAVVHVQRMLLRGQRPVVLDDIHLPGALFKGLTSERLEAEPGPLYHFFEAEFGVRMIRAEERIRAVAADAATAALMAVPEGAPLLSVERLSLTYGDQPVELRRGLYDTREDHYRNHLM